MPSRGDIFACFETPWPGVEIGGFDASDRWESVGRVPGADGVEPRFWEAVKLQANGGGRGRWKRNVDFFADVLGDSRVATTDEPFWLGLSPFSGVSRLWVSTARVRKAKPGHRFERHPGEIRPDRSTLVGLRLTLGDDGTYFEVARP